MQSDATQFSRLDLAFARFLSERANLNAEDKKQFFAIISKLSLQYNHGHSCITLEKKAQQLVLASGMATANKTSPLILEHNRLYLHRCWQYEIRMTTQLKAMLAVAEHQPILFKQSDQSLQALLDRYFTPMNDDIDWQRVAAEKVVQQNFSIITGGPGTGKTSTVLKILALLQELSSPTPLSIALAAPTGKAAMRLQEAIVKNKNELPCPDSLKLQLPDKVMTLHRLLGSLPYSPYFKHHARQPLPYDLIVVDEASMVDLALMSKLFDALKQGARLILLGDKDQLASVEAGSVLADLTAALPHQTLELQKSFRFDGQIKQLADAVNQQAAQQAWNLLLADERNIGLLTTPLLDYIADRQIDYLQRVHTGADFASIYQTFTRFQVLCANRHGRNSVTDINTRVEQELSRRNLIQLTGIWYVGRPVMMTQNDPGLQLYNGDIGLCLPDPQQQNKLMVFFLGTDGAYKKFLPARLPLCETVFAMTIHKSQGSEFDEVLITLPDIINPLLTKELLYTAITRAKKTVKLVVSEAIFKQAVVQKIERLGGLLDKLTTQR